MAASLDTGFGARDTHLRSPDFFAVETWPEIRVVSTAMRQTGDDRFVVTADVTIRDVTRSVDFEVGFLGFGFYPRSGFMHVDLGPARQWGQRFPVRETAFATETAPVREVLADSRTMKGGGAAGVATLGAAGVEVAQSVLAETQTAILPLVPYLDTLRWVFIVVALGGIAVTIYARLDDWHRGQR